MKWYPDVPDLPISKPESIEFIETMDPKARESLPGVEVDEIVDKIAYSVASDYKKKVGGDFEGCVDIVSVALSVTGSSIGGRVGQKMVGANQKAAKNACRIVYDVELIN